MKSIPSSLLILPPPRLPLAQIPDYNQVGLWMHLIKYEATNPQRIEAPLLRARIKTLLKQASLCLRHIPEVRPPRQPQRTHPESRPVGC